MVSIRVKILITIHRDSIKRGVGGALSGISHPRPKLIQLAGKSIILMVLNTGKMGGIFQMAMLG